MTADLLTFPTFTPPAPAEPRPRPTDPQALAWRARIEAMSEDKAPCPGFRPGEWARTRAAILETLDQLGDELVRLGWTERDLFAVDRIVGTTRVGSCGALTISDRVADGVDDRGLRRGNLTNYRGKPGMQEGIPIWEFQPPERKAPKPSDGWR